MTIATLWTIILTLIAITTKRMTIMTRGRWRCSCCWLLFVCFSSLLISSRLFLVGDVVVFVVTLVIVAIGVIVVIVMTVLVIITAIIVHVIVAVVGDAGAEEAADSLRPRLCTLLTR